MKFDYLWIVEMWVPENGQWEATVGAKISRNFGREELVEWKQNNPCDKFRLVKYVRATP